MADLIGIQNILEIPLSETNPEQSTLQLEWSNYGTLKDRMVKIGDYTPDFVLAPHTTVAYRHIMKQKAELGSMGLYDLLSNIAVMVNGSMEYCMQRLNEQITKDMTKIGKTPNVIQTLIKWYSNEFVPKDFVQPKREFKGICFDAGTKIRDAIKGLVDDHDIRSIPVLAGNSAIIKHDTTLVYDRKTEGWVVVNSKAPLFMFNIARREHLEMLGKPYVEPIENKKKILY